MPCPPNKRAWQHTMKNNIEYIDYILSENDISDCIELIESISAFNKFDEVQQSILTAEFQDLYFEGLEQ
jgi:peptidoglycan hydrolase CwlO-like protein